MKLSSINAPTWDINNIHKVLEISVRECPRTRDNYARPLIDYLPPRVSSKRGGKNTQMRAGTHLEGVPILHERENFPSSCRGLFEVRHVSTALYPYQPCRWHFIYKPASEGDKICSQLQRNSRQATSLLKLEFYTVGRDANVPLGVEFWVQYSILTSPENQRLGVDLWHLAADGKSSACHVLEAGICPAVSQHM